jgi:hypothetical protein
MAFKLPPDSPNQDQARRLFCAQAAEELELAAALRAGAMDSTSRHDEVAREVRQTLISLAARARALA